jgi:glycogen phosphorylase
LTPDDVRVEAIVGRVDVEGHLEDPSVLQLSPSGQQGAAHVFERAMVPPQTGRLGYAMRISPNHSDDPLSQPCNGLLKWT